MATLESAVWVCNHKSTITSPASYHPGMASVLSFEDARHTVEAHARNVGPAAPERISLLEARRRVLAEPLYADRDFPPFPRAARDGYAVRAADVATLPARLEVVAEIKAGASPEDIPKNIQPGQAPTRSALRSIRMASSRSEADLRFWHGTPGHPTSCRRQDSQPPRRDDFGSRGGIPTARLLG